VDAEPETPAPNNYVKADLVSGILPVREDGRMLLLQRPTGTWEPPAGRLGSGEGFEEGAVRELYEETGLLITPQRILATWVGRAPSGRLLAAVTYAGRTSGGEVRLSDEHLGYRWVTLDEWLVLPSWWSRRNIRRVAGPVGALREASLPPLPESHVSAPGVVHANLGAGTVLVNLEGKAPRALLLRRRKPPVGLWENPGGMLEPDEDFVLGARRETFEETGLDVEPEAAWWARVEPWRGPDDPELYAGVGFLARYPGGEVRPESAAHDAHLWATEDEWRDLPTWYTEKELDDLWDTIRELDGA
jgi:8-oxo-dGTP diphosphatase